MFKLTTNKQILTMFSNKILKNNSFWHPTNLIKAMHLCTKGLLSALELVGKGAKDQIWVLAQKKGAPPFYISNTLSVEMHNLP